MTEPEPARGPRDDVGAALSDHQERQRLAAVVGEQDWYHTIELTTGIETPGYYDHRPIVSRLPFPDSMVGMRCLDVGTFDGFWAFEMERRGGNVTAIDILDPLQWDWPARAPVGAVRAIGERKNAGLGFEIAAKARGSMVQRIEGSVYDLDPGTYGRFDFVFLGSILLHLRDPIRALEHVLKVCEGRLLSIDAYDPLLTLMHPRRPLGILEAEARPWWWKPNLRGYRQLVHSAGFHIDRGPTRFLIPPGKELRDAPVDLPALRHYEGRQDLIRNRIGDPHAYILARPG